MTLGTASQKYLEDLLDSALNSFDEMTKRWENLEPHNLFNIKDSEDFHVGFLFGRIEQDFVEYFSSNFGRELTKDEYKTFWLISRKRIRKMHEKWDKFFFQE